MKRIIINQIVVIKIGVSLLASVLVSCKKDKLTEPSVENNEKELLVYDAQTDLVVQRIKRFENQLKEVKYGQFREDTYINADSAVWNIESLFNITYASPDEIYIDKKIHELSFEIEVNDNMLSMKDVNDLYDKMISEVREKYRNDGFTNNKALMSLFVTKEETRSGKLNLNVVAVTGKTDCHQIEYKPVLYGPFDYEECWFYGELGGSCDDQYILMDAAELLEDTINYYYGYKPQSISNHRNIYVNMTYVSLLGDEYINENTGENYIFYKKNCSYEELFLDGNELNKYFYNELKVIKELVPNDPVYSSMLTDDVVFMEINIDGDKGGSPGDVIYNHHNYIFYGSSYSVRDDEFGSKKDLLTN